MNPGDKLYRVAANGVLEVVTFVEESLAGPDCTVPTYVVRDSSLHRVSKESYVGSEVEAWERYLREMEECAPEAERSVEAARLHLGWVQDELARVKSTLLFLGSCVRVKDVFTCPECGEHRLEEVMEGVVQSSEVVAVSVTGDEVACEYGGVSYEGGVVVRYQCMVCGAVMGRCEEELAWVLRK